MLLSGLGQRAGKWRFKQFAISPSGRHQKTNKKPTRYDICPYSSKRYKALPKFPATTRDVALVCDAAIESAYIEEKIRKACGSVLEELTVFDVYKGDKIEAGKKSIAYNLVLRDSEKTLTDVDADAAIKRTLKLLAEDNISLRA